MLKEEAEILRKRMEAPAERWLESRRRWRRSEFRLLVFVVAVGLPTLAIPSLRHRLKSRVEVLRQAATAGTFVPQPVTLRVGENPEPFPSEYEKPFEPLPQWSNTSGPAVPTYRAQPGVQQSEQPLAEAAVQGAQAEQSRSADQGPTFAQGRIEKEAYDVLLQSSPALAALVQGSDPALRFRSWAAAKTEDDDSWLVRVTFLYQADGSDREYIWRVKLLSREIMPLSAYARSLSGPKS